MKNELLPCPFCGGSNTYIDGYEHGAGLRWRVVCLDCMGMVDPGTIQQKYRAIEAWNRRVQTESKSTNSDHIRSLTDERLAKIIVAEPIGETLCFCQNKPECDKLLDADDGIPEEMCQQCALEWLRKPAEDTI